MRCKHNFNVTWQDYYQVTFRLCDLCHQLEADTSKGWMPRHDVAQRDIRAFLKAYLERPNQSKLYTGAEVVELCRVAAQTVCDEIVKDQRTLNGWPKE